MGGEVSRKETNPARLEFAVREGGLQERYDTGPVSRRLGPARDVQHQPLEIEYRSPVVLVVLGVARPHPGLCEPLPGDRYGVRSEVPKALFPPRSAIEEVR